MGLHTKMSADEAAFHRQRQFTFVFLEIAGHQLLVFAHLINRFTLLGGLFAPAFFLFFDFGCHQFLDFCIQFIGFFLLLFLFGFQVGLFLLQFGQHLFFALTVRLQLFRFALFFVHHTSLVGFVRLQGQAFGLQLAGQLQNLGSLSFPIIAQLLQITESAISLTEIIGRQDE